MQVRRRSKTYGFLVIGLGLLATLCRPMPFDVFQATFLPFLPSVLGPFLVQGGLGPAFALIGPSLVGRLRPLLVFIQSQPQPLFSVSFIFGPLALYFSAILC